jgi:tRNA 2-selenouridine synthase
LLNVRLDKHHHNIMAIKKITIEEFLQLAKRHPVLDVRSPGEYTHAHMPGARSLPLFSDEERAAVGTAYKQQNREKAIKIGLDYFGVKMRSMVEEVEALLAGTKKKGSVDGQMQEEKAVLVHCWRGGMRSAGVAWLLDLYGFKVYTLAGGYKAYRNWVFQQFEKVYAFNILGGYTGSGKTLVLKELKVKGRSIIDLEGLAHHKGSAFGALGELPQPRQEMFENLLAGALAGHVNNQPGENKPVFLEDESQRIGNLTIPNPVWLQMRNSPVYFLDIPFEERLNYLTDEYGGFEKEKLVNATIRIQKRLGGLETKNAINHLLENNAGECFRILLKYYDKGYTKGLQNRENLPALLNKIPCLSVDTKNNTQQVIHAVSISEKAM